MAESLFTEAQPLPAAIVWLTQADAMQVNAGIDMLLALANIELPVRLVITDDACRWLVAPAASATQTPCPHKRLGLLALYELEPILVSATDKLSTDLEIAQCTPAQLSAALHSAQHIIRY